MRLFGRITEVDLFRYPLMISGTVTIAAGASAYIIFQRVGSPEAVVLAASCITLILSATLLGGRAIELARDVLVAQAIGARQPEDEQEVLEEQPEPEPIIPTPAGFHPLKPRYAQAAHVVINPNRILLTVANRTIPIKMTPDQLHFLAEKVRAGETELSYKLKDQPSPFRRADLDQLRPDFVRKGLADKLGNRVVLHDETRTGIVSTTTLLGY